VYFLIITFGFLLAMRGARPAPLQKPGDGLERILRNAADFFLTTSLILVLWALATAVEKIQPIALEYEVLGFGIAAYLFSRFQKKTDAFFFSVFASVFMIHSRQIDLFHGLSLVWAVSAGIAIFQACFLGLRYKLLFSDTPVSMRGWPSLCLLAGCISLVLWSLESLVF